MARFVPGNPFAFLPIRIARVQRYRADGGNIRLIHETHPYGAVQRAHVKNRSRRFFRTRNAGSRHLLLQSLPPTSM